MSNVPKLRFKEFSGEWKKSLLGKYGNLINGLTYSPNDIVENGLLVLRSSNIQNSQISYDDNVYVNLSVKDEVLTKENDILICVRNGSKRLIGKNALIPSNIPNATHGAFMTIFRGESNKFIFQWLNSSMFFKQVHMNLGATINSINGSDLKKFKVIFPNKQEQEKIASFLASVDRKIEQLTKKEELLQQYKKGVMQKIFNQEIRFKDDDGSEFCEWEEKKLGELFIYRNGGSFESDVIEDGQYNLITLNSIDINGELKLEHKRVNINDNSLSKNDLIMVLSDVAHGNFLGLTAIIPEDNVYVLNQRMGALKPKTNNNISFIRFYINFNQKYFKLHGQGSSQQNLSKGDIEKFIVNIPCLSEQTKIANFLSSIDSKIEQVQKQLNSTKEFKKALLQQMFV